ncbi:MAG: hypothetical protein RI897_578 [Verrucomicrobiota bacterium]
MWGCEGFAGGLFTSAGAVTEDEFPWALTDGEGAIDRVMDDWGAFEPGRGLGEEGEEAGAIGCCILG